MGRPVVFFDIATTDAAQLFGFYKELFDWKIDADNPMGYGMADTGGLPGGIGTAQEGAAKGVSIVVDVDDVPAYLARAEALGGKTVVPPYDIEGTGTLAECTDPQGNRIGLWKR
ncbi:VOC family protein [Nonomuraea sediminis]|uniref:VOC family protein n=1 Tax=Nonomuraea sediminis TaxID=2835864 RepID=UPI001BDBE85E|nr:VOC family protein [Nonomuraea sediminis]